MDQHHLSSARAGISTRTRCALSNPKSEVLPRSSEKEARSNCTTHFMQGNGWSELIEDPTGLEAGNKLKRHLAYEAEVCALKGGSIRQKFMSMDKFHVNNGKLPPFKLCMLAMEYLDELTRDNAAVQPRIPGPAQIIDLHELSNSVLPEAEQNADVEDECDAMSAGHEYCIRGSEYLWETQKMVDPKAVHWRDVSLKEGNRKLEGAVVSKANRLTLSIMSTKIKNKAGRCTRTLPLKEGNRSNCPRRIRDRYLKILERTCSPPNKDEPIFKKRNGKLVTRDRVTKLIQNLLTKHWL